MMKSMILFLCGILLTGGTIAFGVTLSNPGFETPIQTDGTYSVGVPTGWSTTKPASAYWTMNPAITYELQPSEGENFLFMASAGPSGNIYHATTETVAANTLYVLEFDVCCLTAYFGTNIDDHAYYTVNWLAGGSSVYLTSITFLTKPSWTTVRAEFNSADKPSAVGGTMEFYISGAKIGLDNFRMTAHTPRKLTVGVDPADKSIDTVLPLVGQKNYPDGEVVEIKAYDYLNLLGGFYSFSHWDGPVADAAARITTVTMDADKTVTAVYTLDRRECIQRTPGSAILNNSFERPVVAEDAYQTVTSIPGWSIDDVTKTYTIYNEATEDAFIATDGQNHLGMHLAGAGSGQISQILPGKIEANTVYEFSFDVAGFTTGAYFLFSVYASPRSPSHQLATTTATITSFYAWTMVTLTWDSSSHPEWVGSSFDIVVAGKKIFFDNFRVTPLGSWGADMVLDVNADSEAVNGVYLVNSQFELPVMADGDNEPNNVPGWTIDSDPIDVHWIYRPASTYSLLPSEGKNFLYLSPAGPTAQVSQITEAVMETNSVYRLEFDVASPASYAGTPFYYVKVYAAQNGLQNRVPSYLMYDGTVTNILTRDSWIPVTVEIDTTGSPHAGIQKFDIILGGKAAFDNVKMVRTAENAPMALWPAVGQYVYDYNDSAYLYHAGRAARCPDVYRFDNWDGDVEQDMVDGTSVVMNADKTVKAVFSLDTEYTPQCGDICNPYQQTDLNWDCQTNLEDFAALAKFWLETIE